MSRIVPADAAHVAEAAEALRRGGLVVFPTETVYGLGARARDAGAVQRVFAAKGRPAAHPLIVHLPSGEHLGRWTAGAGRDAEELAAAFWPGPLTLVLARASHVPDVVTGGQDTVAVRVPAHPVALALLAELDDGVAGPSANRFGRLSPTRPEHAIEELGDRVAMVLDGGPCEVGVESTILDLSGDRSALLRPGGVPAERLAEVLGEVPRAPEAGAPRAPGGLPSHYAPGAPARLVGKAALERAPAGTALLLRDAPIAEHDGPVARLPQDAEGYARGLYAALRDLDGEGPRAIWIEDPPATPPWEAVHDRLRRACAERPARADGMPHGCAADGSD